MQILFIGALNRFKPPKGGEEYKNQLLFSHLSSHYTVDLVDTHRWKQKPFVLFLLITRLLFHKWDTIIISASSKSVYRLVTFLSYFPSVASKSVYFVIGGYFPTAVLNGVFKLQPYESLKSLVVEGHSMKQMLMKAGYKGVIHVVPNFKKIPRELVPLNKKKGAFRFLFLSRIHPDKGIKEIFEAGKLLYEWGFKDFNIVFLGPIEESYRNQFEAALEVSENMIYGGVLDIMRDTENAYKSLSVFDCMLFPTYWKGEGFPGVLIDAFIAGLPIIASDWNMNNEIIINDVNGLVIPPQNADALARAMERMITDSKLRNRLSCASLECAGKYKIENFTPILKQVIEA